MTYLRARGGCMYTYRVVDKAGNTRDVMLFERSDSPTETRFFFKWHYR
ncbi:DDE-type integrase/transposase/recombinase [Roseibium sp. RKSG952]